MRSRLRRSLAAVHDWAHLDDIDKSGKPKTDAGNYPSRAGPFIRSVSASSFSAFA